MNKITGHATIAIAGTGKFERVTPEEKPGVYRIMLQ